MSARDYRWLCRAAKEAEEFERKKSLGIKASFKCKRCFEIKSPKVFREQYQAGYCSLRCWSQSEPGNARARALVYKTLNYVVAR